MGLGEQLAALGIVVTAAEQQRLLLYLDELLRWNKRINLTAVRERDAAVEKHLVDALTVLPLLRGDERLLDLGSGAGLPGIPLSIVRPGLQVVSVDAVEKKILFQRHAARLLSLTCFEAVHARGEALPQRPGCANGFDLVVSRAFASLPAFLRLALPCLRPDGRVLAMKGAEGERELAAAQDELARLGVRHERTVRCRLPRSGAERTLLLFINDGTNPTSGGEIPG